MPLNKTAGEFIPELGPHDAIAPVSKWAGSPWFALALQHAADVFATLEGTVSGKWVDDFSKIERPTFQPEDILIQEYHAAGKIVFWFQHVIANEERFAHWTADIDPKTAAQLRLINKWPAPSLVQWMAQPQPTVN
jgi:hypothetical protein